MKFNLHILAGLPGTLHVPLGRAYEQMVIVQKDGPPVERYAIRRDGRTVFESTFEIAQIRYLLKHARGNPPPIPAHLRFLKFEVDLYNNQVGAFDVEIFNDSMQPVLLTIFLD